MLRAFWAIALSVWILWLPANCAMAGALITSKKTPSNSQNIITVSKPVKCLSVSPSGKTMVYVTGNELKDWPKGRTIQLPDVFVTSNDEDDPLAWNIKWRGDEQELLISRANTKTYLLIKMAEFKIKKRFDNVFTVWWNSKDTCYLPAVDEARFSPKSKQVWYCGKKTRYIPAGMMVTDISPDGKAMLARVAGRTSRGYSFKNLALLRNGKGTLLNKKPVDMVEYHDADIIRWDTKTSAALVVAGNDMGGGLSTSQLYTVTQGKVRALQDSVPDNKAWVYSPPDWVNDKVLTVIRLWGDEYHGANKYQLVLFDPSTGKLQRLIDSAIHSVVINLDFEVKSKYEGNEVLQAASASKNGNLLAYATYNQKDKSWSIVLTSIKALQKKNK